MKYKWRLFYAIMTMALILSACGKSNSEKDSDNNSNPVGEVEDSKPSGEDNASGDSTEDKDNNDNAEQPTDFLNEAKLVDSDGQDYSIYVLPNYKLTSEEPGRDILYWEDNASFFMRIETMLAEEGTYDYLAENMQAVLIASSGGNETPVKLTDKNMLPTGESIINPEVYTVDTDSGSVTGVLFEKGNIIVRLTIFDSTEASFFESFLRMGETVVPK